ncbi:hypothetical protein D3C79_614740 [compost metagenome]
MAEQVAVVGVFVVDRHQGAVVVAGEGKQAHAVVVVTELQFLGQGAAIAGRVEGRGVGMQRLAPTDQYPGLVAWRQADAVGGGGGDAGKAQQAAAAGADAGRQYAAAEQIATEKQRRAAQGASADEAAAAETGQVFKVGWLMFF